jgi:NADH-ubiquinone oxidoreductase chain 3
LNFFLIIFLLSFILLLLNISFSYKNPYMEKKSAFECGYHSFLWQNRVEFSISFFIFGLLFLIFDLEILLTYPYVISSYYNNMLGLIIILIFFIILTLGFLYEIGKKALMLYNKK